MKRAIKNLVIVTICIFNLSNSYSQKNLKPGYVVDIHNDTIKGSIDYRNWDKTPKAIVFKDLSDQKATSYTPNSIQSFSVVAERYVSGVVTTDKSGYSESNLTETEILQYKTETVFLQVLVVGSKSLYYLKDENSKTFFFIWQNGIFEPLEVIKYLQKGDGAYYIQTKEKFKGQLNYYLQDCPSIQERILNVSYTKNDLIKLFNDYYKCTQKEIPYQREFEKIKVEFGITGGLSITKIELFGHDYFQPLIDSDYPLSKNFAFGGSFSIIFPRTLNRWSIRNELLFTTYKVNGFNLDSNDPNIYTKTYTSIGYSYIKLNNLLRFKYPAGKLFLFVNGGMSNGITVSETNWLRAESHVFSVNNILETEAFINSKKWERGYIVGLGTELKKFSFEFRYEKSDGMSTYALLSSPVKRYFLILGFRF
jgi:hypothetical protein